MYVSMLKRITIIVIIIINIVVIIWGFEVLSN